jgi:hypothetical protein
MQPVTHKTKVHKKQHTLLSERTEAFYLYNTAGETQVRRCTRGMSARLEQLNPVGQHLSLDSKAQLTSAKQISTNVAGYIPAGKLDGM